MGTDLCVPVTERPMSHMTVNVPGTCSFVCEGGPRGDLCMLTCNTVHMYIRDSARGSSDPEEALTG